MSTDVELTWRPSAHARRLLTLTAVALLLGLGTGRPALVALAAAPLSYLLMPPRSSPPGQLSVQAHSMARRCFEGEPVDVCVRAQLREPVGLVRIELRPAPRVRVCPGHDADSVAADPTGSTLNSQVQIERWGRRPIGTVHVSLWTYGDLLRCVVAVGVGDVAVFPQPTPVRRLDLPPGRVVVAGDHVSRTTGPGVELGDIRPFSTGDPVKRINWPVSTRLGRLHVTTTAAERALDVVIAVDVFDDVGPPGASTVDLAVRGATGLARVLLRSHDRVGVVAIGGWLRWVRTDVGERQFYRVAEAMLDVMGRESFVEPDLRHLPRAALPSGSVVVLFSPLLDDRGKSAILQLRSAGHPVTVVDTLTTAPDARSPVEQVARRLWQLDRAASRLELAGLGVPVVHWDGHTPLDAVLGAMLRRTAGGAR